MPLRNNGEKNEEILPPSYFEAPGKETFSLTEHSLMSQTLSHGILQTDISTISVTRRNT